MDVLTSHCKECFLNTVYEWNESVLDWERFETDTGECDYDGDENLTLNCAYVQHWLVSWRINIPTTNHQCSPYVRHLIRLAVINQTKWLSAREFVSANSSKTFLSRTKASSSLVRTTAVCVLSAREFSAHAHYSFHLTICPLGIYLGILLHIRKINQTNKQHFSIFFTNTCYDQRSVKMHGGHTCMSLPIWCLVNSLRPSDWYVSVN